MDIPQAFNSCFSSLPQVIYLSGHEPPSWWIDVLKTLVATFLGAGLAFAANLHFQVQQRKKDQRTAGNLALATLSRQYGDFVIAKATFEMEAKEAQLRIPEIPLWRALKPTIHEFNSELLFDFEALAFLVEDGNNKLFEKLVHVETKYHDLRRVLAMHTDAAILLQKKLEELTQLSPPKQITSEEQLKQFVGDELSAKLEALTLALKNRVTKSEATYVAAGKQLHEFMIAKFKNKVFPFSAFGAKAGLSLLENANEKPQ